MFINSCAVFQYMLGTYVSDRHVLAHERLAIVGVDSGAQPLVNKDCCGSLINTNHNQRTDKSSGPIILCVNGEIYNHRELRAKHCSHSHFNTESDCEVITHLYEKFVDQDSISTFLNEINGIFGFVLVDEQRDRYIVARDHIGIIPLYWGRDEDGGLWISSELKALSDICVQFEDFPPGYFYDSQSDTKYKWYQPPWHDEKYLPTTTLNLPILRQQLESAVSRQLMSDVPYGVLLSGGLDSSLIASIAARICAKRTDHNNGSDSWWPRLHSFSVGLKDSPDLAAAQRVAAHIGSVHHAFVFTIDDGLNAYDDVIYHLETYDVTTIRAATPMYLMSRKIKAMGVKMVLSGEGADEIFGGYLYFHKCPNISELQQELVRKLKLLYKYDCLRANKATMSWGVEARVPFLDREFLDYSMSISPADKLCGVHANGRIEKHILREAFSGTGYLPDDVLWRQKEQFSDGVGYNWIDSIKARAESKISDLQMTNAHLKYPYNTPQTKEAYYIRSVFNKHFPGKSAEQCVPGGPSVACSTPAAIAWDESFRKFADQSGRSVQGVHTSAYDNKHIDNAKGEQIKDINTAKFDTTEYKSTIAGKTANTGNGSAN